MNKISKSWIGFVSVVTGALVVFGAVHFTSWGKDTIPNIAVSNTPIDRDAKLGTSFAPIVKKAAPSVVNIYSSRVVRMQPNPLMQNPLFQQFFGNQFPDEQPRTRNELSLGSGVIVSPNGYILTANHVVQGADEIKIALGGDTRNEYTAKVIGTDPKTDIAVLKIDAKNLPAITLGDSDQLEIGDIVLAIGNPFGFGQTVTMGIVSGLGRHGYDINGAHDFEDFIQTDAAINPGNSGGALVDADGRLIGINTWIATSSGGSEGVGFAVPINMARNVMERLISGGKVTRGYLGVSIGDLTPGLAESFNYSKPGGALVGDVFPNTPAAKAGIKDGDIITEFNDKPVTDANSLTLMVSQSQPGTEATLKVFRDGAIKTFKVTLQVLPGEKGQNSSGKNSINSSTTDALDGVTVEDLDQDARQELQIPDNIHGAIVTDIDPDSNSADAGLQKNDVIIGIDRHPVTTADNAVKLAEAAKGKQILLKIWRREGDFASTTYISVDNTKRKNSD